MWGTVRQSPSERVPGFWSPWGRWHCCKADTGPRAQSSQRHWKQAGRRGRRGRTAKCPQGLCSRLGLPTQRETQRHIRETSQVEGPRIFSSVSFPGMGEKSHEGDILQRAGESKHTMFRASVWAPFDQVSIYW